MSGGALLTLSDQSSVYLAQRLSGLANLGAAVRTDVSKPAEAATIQQLRAILSFPVLRKVVIDASRRLHNGGRTDLGVGRTNA